MTNNEGFSILATGFTGIKALDFKCAFYDEFEHMVEELKNRDDSLQVTTLTPAKQLSIQQAVSRRAQKTANHYQTIYRAIKLHYQITRYDQLP